MELFAIFSAEKKKQQSNNLKIRNNVYICCGSFTLKRDVLTLQHIMIDFRLPHFGANINYSERANV